MLLHLYLNLHVHLCIQKYKDLLLHFHKLHNLLLLLPQKFLLSMLFHLYLFLKLLLIHHKQINFHQKLIHRLNLMFEMFY